MSRSRLAFGILLATTVAAAAATPAHARRPKPAPKPFCNLVTDPVEPSSPTYDPSLDIVSADIANNAQMLTAVIRVKDLTQASQASPTGRTWSITFTNGTQSVGMSAYLSDAFGPRFSTGKGTFDYAKDEIRIHHAMADIAYAKIVKGSMLRGFYVTSNSTVAFDPDWGLGYGFSPLGGSVDSATAPQSAYPAFALSCVKVGQ